MGSKYGRPANLFGALAVLLLVGTPTRGDTAPRVNVLLILADDLGYGDLACQGHPYIETPHLDRLARQGLRGTNFYADAPVCSPTRAALLTGRWPQRNGLTNVIEASDHRSHLADDEQLLSEWLSTAGYATAIVGKWHLGEAHPDRPQRRGFDYFFGNLLGGIDFFRHDFLDGRHDLWEGDVPVRHDQRYVTDLLAEKSVAWLKQQNEQPWFLYLSFEAVHTSMGSQDRGNIQSPPRWLKRYENKLGKSADESVAVKYAACVSAMDEAIGEVLAAIDALGQTERTLVLFTSDNGPEPRQSGTASPYFGTKHTLWEGGIRVPLIVRWPGRVPADTQSAVPGMISDLAPTVVAAAGIDPPDGVRFDGRSLLPQLLGAPPDDAERMLFWSYIRDTQRISRERAVRWGPWKWLNGELYQLEHDPTESRDVASEHAEVAERLARGWRDWVRQFPAEVDRWADRQPLRHPSSLRHPPQRR